MASCLVYHSRFLKDSELIFLLACHLLLILPINQDNQRPEGKGTCYF